MASTTKTAGTRAAAVVKTVGADVATLAGLMVQQTVSGNHQDRVALAETVVRELGPEVGLKVAQEWVKGCLEARC